MCHIFFLHSSVGEHLGSFQFLAIMSKGTVDVVEQVWPCGRMECSDSNEMSLIFNGLAISPAHTDNKAATKIFYLQSVLPTRGTGAKVVQSIWEWSTNVWFNLGPALQGEVKAGHCLDGQDPETG